MKLETVLRAAKNSMIHGKRAPHCHSGTPEQLARAVQNEIDCINTAPGYSEPGYSDADRGVVLAEVSKSPVY